MAANPDNDPIVQMWNALQEGGKNDGLINGIIRIVLAVFLLPFVMLYGAIRELFSPDNWKS